MLNDTAKKDWQYMYKRSLKLRNGVQLFCGVDAVPVSTAFIFSV